MSEHKVTRMKYRSAKKGARRVDGLLYSYQGSAGGTATAATAVVPLEGMLLRVVEMQPASSVDGKPALWALKNDVKVINTFPDYQEAVTALRAIAAKARGTRWWVKMLGWFLVVGLVVLTLLTVYGLSLREQGLIATTVSVPELSGAANPGNSQTGSQTGNQTGLGWMETNGGLPSITHRPSGQQSTVPGLVASRADGVPTWLDSQ